MYEKYFAQATWFRQLSFSEQILEHLISGYGVLNLSINYKHVAHMKNILLRLHVCGLVS
jgi:hypothetical protein